MSPDEKETIDDSFAVVIRWEATEGWPIHSISEGISQFGYKAEDFLSKKITWNDITIKEDIPGLKEDLQKHLDSDCDHFDQEYRLVCSSGQIRWVEDRTIIIRDDEGSVSALVGTIMDITAIKEREDLLISQAGELIRLEESLSRANKILHLQSNIAKALWGPDENLSVSSVFEEVSRELDLNTTFVYQCSLEAPSLLSSWTRPNGRGAWGVPEIGVMTDEDYLALRSWVDNNDYLKTKTSELPKELTFLSNKSFLEHVGTIVLVGVNISSDPWALVGFGTPNGRPWSNNELEALSALARIIAFLSKSRNDSMMLKNKINDHLEQISVIMERVDRAEREVHA
jgi:PAS domain S-box-containing protein